MPLEPTTIFSLSNILCGVVANSCSTVLSATSKKVPAFGKLLRAGKLDANHDLEKLAHESLGTTLQLLNRAIAKRQEQNPDSQIESNYFKDCLHDLINDKRALATLSQHLSIESDLLLSIPASTHEGIARVLHPSLLSWLRAEFARKPYGKDRELPGYFVEFIKEGFPNPDEFEETMVTCADTFSNHYLAKLKSAASKKDIKALRAFERLENQEIRERLIALGESQATDSDLNAIEEALGDLLLELEMIVESLESLHEKMDTVLEILTTRNKPSIQPVTTLESLPLLSLGERFTGREDILHDLIGDHFSQAHQAGNLPIVLNGPPGVGKTTLACELLYRLLQLKTFTHLLHVRALDPASLRADLAALPVRLRLIDSEASAQASPEQLIEFLVNNLDQLGSDARVLLYIDNADSQDAIDEILRLLPQLRSLPILITSRRTDWEEAHPVPIPLWEKPAALAYLAKALPQHHPDQRLSLYQQLGGLPLALDLASNRILRRRLTVEQLHTLWQENLPEETLTKRIRDSRQSTLGNVTDQEINTLYSLVQISLQDLTPESLELLKLLSVFAPAPLPEKVLALNENPSHRNSLLALPDSSLLDWNPQEADLPPHLLFHPFLQQIIRQSIPGNEFEPLLKSACTHLVHALPYPEIRDHDWSHWPFYLPHTLALDEGAKAKDLKPPELASVLNNAGYYYKYKANYQEAEPLYRRALLINEASFGKDHPNVARDLNNLATLLQDTNRLDEAEPLMRRALQIIQDSLGSEHPNTQTIAQNLSLLLSELEEQK